MIIAEQTQSDNPVDTALEEVNELSLLKQRASLMGITFSNNIGIDKLRERIKEKLEENEVALPKQSVATAPVVPVKVKTLRQHLIETNMKLVRLRITNLDPKKANLPGEIITVANEYIGTVRKFIPFGEVTNEGYHVPHVIYEVLKSRKFLNIRTVKNPNKIGEVMIQQNWVNEFALDVLPPLTKEELEQLAITQAASGGVS